MQFHCKNLIIYHKLVAKKRSNATFERPYQTEIVIKAIGLPITKEFAFVPKGSMRYVCRVTENVLVCVSNFVFYFIM